MFFCFVFFHSDHNLDVWMLGFWRETKKKEEEREKQRKKEEEKDAGKRA